MNVDMETTGKTYWGRATWALIHVFASMAVAPEQLKTLDAWMHTLPSLVPCKSICGPHLEENLAKLPLQKYIDMKKTALEWSYVLHDEVNRQTEKTSPALSVVMTYYRPSRINKYGFYRDFLWAAIHSIAYDYHPDTQQAMIRFMALTGLLLPDPQSRQRWIEFTNKYELKLYLHSMYDLLYYTYMLYTYMEQHAKYDPMSIDEFKQYYRHRFGDKPDATADASKCSSCS